MAAARLGAKVTATDQVGILAKLRVRAEAEDLQLKVREARPEALPFLTANSTW